ncbi:AEC family transporter [Salmonella enterica]|nr:AEC family transporter [Salmonella enterica]EDM2051517.1 AEC family transporter [Salmonella enterica subsp. enterica serovar Muenchen]EGF6411721.1 AEC family transporter [Salmonella enterica subsp. enterica serovar 6,8:d:-]EAM5847645.1 AEC family transporter [Salmonella enterica]EAM5857063.1 AEC family transporter [Salmonella enterica]
MDGLTLKVFGLFFISCIGFVYGALSKAPAKNIADLLIKIISPIVVIISIVQSPAGVSYLFFSLVAFLFCSVLCVLAYAISYFLFNGKERNLFAFTAGTGNTGYFALPIALSLFNENQIAIVIFIIIGVNLYEFSVGYYVMNMNGSIREALQKTLRLPVIHAAIIGVIIKYIGISINENILSILNNFKGAYSVIGMLIIGMVLSVNARSKPDLKFLFVTLSWKHLLVPLISCVFVFLPKEQFIVILLMALTPLAGNTVVFSSSLDLHPEKAASAVLLSSLVSIVLIPISMNLIL